MRCDAFMLAFITVKKNLLNSASKALGSHDLSQAAIREPRLCDSDS